MCIEKERPVDGEKTHEEEKKTEETWREEKNKGAITELLRAPTHNRAVNNTDVHRTASSIKVLHRKSPEAEHRRKNECRNCGRR